MQTFGLPRQITRGAALASRLGGAERSEAAPRRDAFERWRQARADGLTARAAANAVGVPRSTLYRWQRLADRNRLDPCSRRPHTLRRPAWSAALVAAVQEIRADYPMWGKAKIAVLNGLPRGGRFVFPNRKGDGSMTDLGLRWHKLRDLAGLDGARIHDCRHTFASHAVMNGLDLYTVGRLLGHRQRETTAIYAHLDDGALRDAAAQAAAIIARAMGYRAVPTPVPEEMGNAGDGMEPDRLNSVESRVMRRGPLDPAMTANRSRQLHRMDPESVAEESPQRQNIDWLNDDPSDQNSDSTATGRRKPSAQRDLLWI